MDAYRRKIQDLAEQVSPSTGERWIAWSYLNFICDLIMKEMKRCPQGARIIVNAPPRHGKSLLISKWLPVWYLELFPKRRVLLASYAAELAAHWGRQVRDVFNANGELWTSVKAGTGASDRWETTEGGGMLTAGVGGGITGFGGHLMIIDDPCKNWMDAHSPTMRKHEQDWFQSTFYTRREPGAHIIVLMQRWHEDDLTGYLTKRHSDNWLHITLPAVAEQDDALGRPEGAALCPERFDERALAAIKAAQGSKWWGLYQQRPLPAEGSIIKPQWLRFYNTPPTGLRPVAISLDAAFKDNAKNSFVVIQAWGKRGPNRYLLDQIREHMDYPPTEAALIGMVQRHPRCRARLIEDKANGSAIIQRMRSKISGIIPISPRESKEARAQAVSPIFEAGNVWLPEKAAWVNDYVAEVTSFPSCAFDDQVDATTQFLNWDTARSKMTGGGFGSSVPH